ncbi:hypothetical protein P154DRAFT_571231 [Amniculicola lignicola CBS 123094]|uniref:Uncharacterized protein n=1 Tax=Amniculicola lignicola CBS 123094 TaxID=1392246 RepID=A0A6A5X1G1_9PLEO|nr:hypothetical protein P154DRAFT_571231 [Amniculicola lignicola CBS 123094]
MSRSRPDHREVSTQDGVNKKSRKSVFARVKNGGRACLDAIKGRHRQAAAPQDASAPPPDRAQNADLSASPPHATSPTAARGAHPQPSSGDDRITATQSVGAQTLHKGIGAVVSIGCQAEAEDRRNSDAQDTIDRQDTLTKQLQSTIEDLQSRLSAEEVTNACLKIRKRKNEEGLALLICLLKANLEAKAAAHEATTQANTDLQKECDALQKEIETLQQEVEGSNELANKLKELRGEFKALNQHADRMGKDKCTMEEELEIAKVRLAKLQAEMEYHRTQHDQRDRLRNEQEAQIIELSDRNAEMAFKLVAADHRMVNIHESLDEYRSLVKKNESVFEEQKAFFRVNPEKRTWFQNRHSILAKHSKKVRELEQETMEKNEEIGELHREKSEIIERYKQLTVQSAKTQEIGANEKTALGAKVARYAAEAEALRKERDDTTAENASLRMALSCNLNLQNTNEDLAWEISKTALKVQTKKVVELRKERTHLVFEIEREKQEKSEALILIEQWTEERKNMRVKTEDLKTLTLELATRLCKPENYDGPADLAVDTKLLNNLPQIVDDLRNELINTQDENERLAHALALKDPNVNLHAELGHVKFEHELQLDEVKEEFQIKYDNVMTDLTNALVEIHNLRHTNHITHETFKRELGALFELIPHCGPIEELDRLDVCVAIFYQLCEKNQELTGLHQYIAGLWHEFDMYRAGVEARRNSSASSGSGYPITDRLDSGSSASTANSSTNTWDREEEMMDCS